MKKASIAGPIVLILIGTAFLVKNLWPEIRLFELVMNYWPILLIGWGLLRLAEIVIAYARGGNLPVAGVSGGEWALIIVFTVISSSIWGVERWTKDNFGRIRIGGLEVFGETFEFPVEQQSAKAGAKPRLIIDNPRGAVRVTAGSGEEIVAAGRKTVKALDKDKAGEFDRQSKVELKSSGEAATLSVSGAEPEGATVTVDLEVTAPPGAAVEVRGRSGDVEVTGLSGGVKVERESGGVRLRNVGGKVEIDSRRLEILRASGVAGDVAVRGRGRDIEMEDVTGAVSIEGSYSGETQLRRIGGTVRFQSAVTEFRMESIPGELSLTLSALNGTKIKGPFVMKAKSKDVQLSEVSDSIRLDVGRGDVEIRQPSAPVAKMDVEVESGDIEVALPPGAKFSIDGETRRGEIANSYSDQLKTESSSKGGKLTGTLGSGPELRLRTGRGLVNLRKASAVEPAISQPVKPGALRTLPPPQKAENQ